MHEVISSNDSQKSLAKSFNVPFPFEDLRSDSRPSGRESCAESGGLVYSGQRVEFDQRIYRHRARLVLGWVTVCGRVNHLGMQQVT